MTENRYEQDFIYLLVESMLLLNNKSAVEAPGKASESTEESRQHQEHQRQGDLKERRPF